MKFFLFLGNFVTENNHNKAHTWGDQGGNKTSGFEKVNCVADTQKTGDLLAMKVEECTNTKQCY